MNTTMVTYTVMKNNVSGNRELTDKRLVKTYISIAGWDESSQIAGIPRAPITYCYSHTMRQK